MATPDRRRMSRQPGTEGWPVTATFPRERLVPHFTKRLRGNARGRPNSSQPPCAELSDGVEPGSAARYLAGHQARGGQGVDRARAPLGCARAPRAPSRARSARGACATSPAYRGRCATDPIPGRAPGGVRVPQAPPTGLRVPRASGGGRAAACFVPFAAYGRGSSWSIRASRSIRGTPAHQNNRRARIHRGNRRTAPAGVAPAMSCDGCDVRGRGAAAGAITSSSWLR